MEYDTKASNGMPAPDGGEPRTDTAGLPCGCPPGGCDTAFVDTTSGKATAKDFKMVMTNFDRGYSTTSNSLIIFIYTSL